MVIARFNSFINERLLEGAVDALKRIGQVKDENITIVRAPGAYELPLVARRLAESKKFDAIVALGTVIRGEERTFTIDSLKGIKITQKLKKLSLPTVAR